MRPRTTPSGKILTHPIDQSRLLAYMTVKFQLHSSINVRLTESSVYYRLCIERSRKMGVWGDFGGRGKDIWWESTSVL